MKRCSVLSVLISCVSQVQITMEQMSIQEWTDLRTGVWTSPEPPDPAGLQEAWYTALLTLDLEIHLHLKEKVRFEMCSCSFNILQLSEKICESEEVDY